MILDHQKGDGEIKYKNVDVGSGKLIRRLKHKVLLHY